MNLDNIILLLVLYNLISKRLVDINIVVLRVVLIGFTLRAIGDLVVKDGP